jgi:hypothetical protein
MFSSFSLLVSGSIDFTAEPIKKLTPPRGCPKPVPPGADVENAGRLLYSKNNADDHETNIINNGIQTVRD